jgi:acyl-CoA thioester hydrolase
MSSKKGGQTPISTSINVRVRYAETDKMGVVYHANYLIWFEVGRCELLRTIGSSYRDLEATGIMLPVIEAHCEYRAPARYDDELQVKTWGELLSPARVEFHYEVSRPSDGTVNAVGRTVHAAIDDTGRPCRLPDHIRDLFR